MKNLNALIAVCFALALTAGCGLQEDETTPPVDTSTPDAGTTPTPDAGDTTTPDAGTTPTPDTTAPVVTITAPAAGSGTESSTITVTGTATDEVGVTSVKVNGQDCSLSGTSFSCENVALPIAGSEYTLTAEAKDAAGNKGTASVTIMVYLPAPFRSGAPYVLDVSVAYVSGSLCGELRGNLPGMSWTGGPFVKDDNAGAFDGYMGTVYNVAAGSYQMSYVDRLCPGETSGSQGNWADYGNLRFQMSKFSPTARAWLYCEQYVPSSNSCQVVTNPGCNIRFSVASNGVLTPAGNMGGFNAATATGCW